MSVDRKFLLEELKKFGIALEDPDAYSIPELKEMLYEKGWKEPAPKESSVDGGP